MKLKLTSVVVTVVPVVLLAVAGLGFRGGEKQAAGQKPPPPAVTVAPVETKEVVEMDEFTGRVEPLETVEVRPRVSGYIQQVRFQSGQMVNKGDVLFVIDQRWHQATFDQRQAEFEQAQVRADLAGREAERTSQLLTNRAISVEEADARQARFREAKANLLASRAALDSARLDLDYTQVRAPIGGRVSRALLTEGNYVNGVAGGATLLTTIVTVDPVYVYADIDENSFLRFNTLAATSRLETDGNGKVPVEMQLADEAEFPHRGYIESINNRLDSDTGSILLRAVFPNKDGRVVPGLFARIRVPLSERHSAMLVAERAIGTDQAQKFVLTLTPSNTVAYQSVELGPAIDGKRVVRAGLEGTEAVVVNGLQRVRPGMTVTPQSAVASKQGKDERTFAGP
jgi:RND family efflux transporter MFP subunit